MAAVVVKYCSSDVCRIETIIEVEEFTFQRFSDLRRPELDNMSLSPFEFSLISFNDILGFHNLLSV